MSNFMMNMISWVLLLLVILTLYLIDKINQLATMYEAPKPDMPLLPEPELPGDLLFAGLEGKKLWDAMNGRQIEGFDASVIDALRPHYEPILREHITATFRDGLEEAGEEEQEGGSDPRVPSSTRKISTVRGFIQSWLPPQHLGSIYRAALEFGGSYLKNQEPEVLLRLQQTVDSVVDMLYQRVGITNEVPFSEFLFEEVPDEDHASEHATDQSQDTLMLTDASAQSEALEGVNALEDSTDFELTPEQQAQALAEGLANAQAYEDEQRQEIAAETVEAIAVPEEAQEVAETALQTPTEVVPEMAPQPAA
jgi:antitoxin component of RelBE/YafQ-DinJ toxin-antitoxin module